MKKEAILPKFGIEQEHFIFRRTGESPDLEEMEDFFQRLINFGFKPKKYYNDGKIASANKDTPNGYISIKNDFCTHILEVAFPPATSIGGFSYTYLKTWELITKALDKISVEIKLGGALPKEPQKAQLVSHERLDWMLNRKKPSIITALWHQSFTTLMCASQVHLLLNPANFYRTLNSLYGLEYLVPLLFSNSTNYLGNINHCSRPLAWRANFHEDYLAFAIPSRIPSSEIEYNLLLRASNSFIRDYSFIAPRAHGTIEFRSACSQDTIETLLQLTSLRIANSIAATTMRSEKHTRRKDLFYTVCRSGRAPSEIISEDLKTLKTAALKLPHAWKRLLEPTLGNLELIHE